MALYPGPADLKLVADEYRLPPGVKPAPGVKPRDDHVLWLLEDLVEAFGRQGLLVNNWRVANDEAEWCEKTRRRLATPNDWMMRLAAAGDRAWHSGLMASEAYSSRDLEKFATKLVRVRNETYHLAQEIFKTGRNPVRIPAELNDAVSEIIGEPTEAYKHLLVGPGQEALVDQEEGGHEALVDQDEGALVDQDEGDEGALVDQDEGALVDQEEGGGGQEALVDQEEGLDDVSPK